MCLLIAKPADTVLKEEVLANGFLFNNHGAGFAYAKDGKLFLRKGFITFKSFWKAFNPIQKNNPAIVHFRLTSSGATNRANCHPFFVNKDKNICVAHNGTLEDFKLDDCPHSDTTIFVDSILKPLFKDIPDAHKRAPYPYIISQTISCGNKLVFLDGDGTLKIIREHAGHWFENAWYSNISYRKSQKKDKVPRNPFVPRNQTEQILGARSRLGERDENKRMHSGSSKDYDASTRFDNQDDDKRSAFNKDMDEYADKLDRQAAVREYMQAAGARNTDRMDRIESFVLGLDHQDVRDMLK